MESRPEVHDASHDPNSKIQPDEEQIITPSPTKPVDDQPVASSDPLPSDDQQSSTGSSSSKSGECVEGSSSTAESGEIKMQDDNAESEPACKLCARSFKSHKALYGHMRSHSKKEVTGDDEAKEARQQKEQHGLIDLACAAVELQNGTMETSDAEQEAKRMKLRHSDGHHACHICGRSFPTHQALGGHAASHNKDRHRQSEDGDQTSKKSVKKASGESEHRCKKCGAVFKTGQSLGGHMRAHYDLGKDKTIGDVKVDAVMEEPSSPCQTSKDAPIILFGKSISINAVEETNRSPTIEGDAPEKNGLEEITFLENVRGELAGPISDFNEISEREAEEMCRLKL